MTTLLLLFACTSEPERLDSTGDFYARYAEAVCDHGLRCDPDSWALKDGEAVCQIEIRRQWTLTDPCLSIDLDQAEACVTAIELSTCIEGTMLRNPPEACWDLYVYDPSCEAFLPDDMPAREPGSP